MPDDNAPLDSPLTDPKDALPERDGFARLLAKAILRRTGKSATSYALCGGWGSGKSTVANLVEHYIRDKVDVIRFEPWMVGNSEALARELFLEIAKKIFSDQNGKENLEMRRAYYSYASNIIEVLGAAGTAYAALGDSKPGLLAGLFTFGKSIAKSSADGLEQLAKVDTLRQRRDRIKEGLGRLQRPIVMIVDDVDRLDAEEIRTLFRVVKACADFPNVRYLLLFDRLQVARALGGKEEQGEEFLEKIVNVMVDIPVIGDDDRMAILRVALEPITDHVQGEDAKQRLEDVFQKVLKPGLTTLRMAKRFAATAESLALGMEDAGGANYDPADFLLLEFLRSQYPNVHRLAVRYKIDPLHSIRKQYQKDEAPGTPWSRAMQAALEATGESETLVRDAVKLLRPDLNLATGEGQTGAFPKTSAFRRFFNPLWQGMYLGFDRNKTPLSEASWRKFVEKLEGQDEDAGLPEELTEGNSQSSVAGSVSYRLAELSLRALDRLAVSVLRWAEPCIEDGPDQKALTQARVQAGAMLAVAVLNERWARDEEVLERLDQLAAEADASVMRVVVLADLDSMRNRMGREFWGPHEEVEKRFQEVVHRVEALQSEKTIFTVPGADYLMRAWSRFVGSEISKAWYAELHLDEELMVTYIEHQYTIEDAAREFSSRSGIGDFAQAVLDLPTERLGPRGREIQKRLQAGKRQYELNMLRAERAL